MEPKSVRHPPNRPANPSLPARQLALDALNRIEADTSTLDGVLEKMQPFAGLRKKSDRALLNALVFGVARWRGRLDFIIGHCSHTPIKKIDPRVLNALRLGVFQLTHLDRIPPSAAVDTTVELVKQFAPEWVVRYTNAVMRRAAEDCSSMAVPDLAADPVKAVAVRTSFPHWLVRRWIDRHGTDETLRRCDLLNQIPPITLRTNTIKTTRPELLSAIADEAATVAPTPVAPDGIRLTGPKRPIDQMTAFRWGWFQVQDEAAQLVTILLPLRPGDQVLDACAGLGGKTGHIAQRLENKGSIVAADNSRSRLDRLERQMLHMGIQNVQVVSCDLSEASRIQALGHFDRILLDAPCSGMGVIRRNPDTKWKIRERMLPRFARIQSKLLENLARLVNPRGHLVYAVCSGEPEEGRQVVEQFLQRHPQFTVDNPRAQMPEQATNLIDADGYFCTVDRPDMMDGFFAARLQRIK